MNVRIKQFDVEMVVKNKGIELEIKSPDGGTHLGDMIVTKSGVNWCKGRTRPENGKKLSWEKLIMLIEDNG